MLMCGSVCPFAARSLSTSRFSPIGPVVSIQNAQKNLCDCLLERSASFMTGCRIIRDDGLSDDITGQVFDSYDAAYAVLG